MEMGGGVPGGMVGVNDNVDMEVEVIEVFDSEGVAGAIGVICVIGVIGVIIMISIGLVSEIGINEVEMVLGVVVVMVLIGDVIGVDCIILMFDTFII